MPRQPYRLCVVCSGNICRSPMAEFLLREMFEDAGLGEDVVVDSAGTTSWEAGNPADPRTLATLRRNGHEDAGWGEHVARTFERPWFDQLDLVLAADSGHLRDLRKLARSDQQRDKIHLLREFDSDSVASGELEMADPWYGDDRSFDQTYAEVVAAGPGIVDYVRTQLEAQCEDGRHGLAR